MLGASLWQFNVGVWKMAEFLMGVELPQEGSVTKEVTPFFFSPYLYL